MARTCCLAGIDRAMVPMFRAVFKAAGARERATVARLDVAALGRMAPDLLVCDVDELEVDPLELLRRIRFVLPDCIIAVYTGVMQRTWGRACHLAGASCLLSKDSDEACLAQGMRDALGSGCYTDPRFAAAELPTVASGATPKAPVALHQLKPFSSEAHARVSAAPQRRTAKEIER